MISISSAKYHRASSYCIRDGSRSMARWTTSSTVPWYARSIPVSPLPRWRLGHDQRDRSRGARERLWHLAGRERRVFLTCEVRGARDRWPQRNGQDLAVEDIAGFPAALARHHQDHWTRRHAHAAAFEAQARRRLCAAGAGV